MRTKFWIVITIIMITGGVAWLDYSHSNAFLENTKNVQTLSKPAPNFMFKQVDRDVTHQLSDFNGKMVLINFWASWCVPCLHEYPLLVKLASEHPDDLVLILLSSDKGPEQAYEFSHRFFYAAQQGKF